MSAIFVRIECVGSAAASTSTLHTIGWARAHHACMPLLNGELQIEQIDDGIVVNLPGDVDANNDFMSSLYCCIQCFGVLFPMCYGWLSHDLYWRRCCIGRMGSATDFIYAALTIDRRQRRNNFKFFCFFTSFRRIYFSLCSTDFRLCLGVYFIDFLFLFCFASCALTQFGPKKIPNCRQRTKDKSASAAGHPTKNGAE